MVGYVQPIAQHVVHDERLVLRGDDDRDYLWFGDGPGSLLLEVESGTLNWLLSHPGLHPLPEPRIWIHVDDLPLSAERARK